MRVLTPGVASGNLQISSLVDFWKHPQFPQSHGAGTGGIEPLHATLRTSMLVLLSRHAVFS